jgi:hypothetical protein
VRLFRLGESPTSGGLAAWRQRQFQRGPAMGASIQGLRPTADHMIVLRATPVPGSGCHSSTRTSPGFTRSVPSKKKRAKVEDQDRMTMAVVHTRLEPNHPATRALVIFKRALDRLAVLERRASGLLSLGEPKSAVVRPRCGQPWWSDSARWAAGERMRSATTSSSLYSPVGWKPRRR